MFGVTLRPSFAPSLFRPTSRASFLSIVLLLFAGNALAVPCAQVIRGGQLALASQEWSSRYPAAPTDLVLDYWLEKNSGMDKTPTAEEIEAQLASPEVKVDTGIAVGFAENSSVDEGKQAAVYNFVHDISDRVGGIPWEPYLPGIGRPAQLVLQNNDSMQLFFQTLIERAGLQPGGWTSYISTAAIAAWIPWIGIPIAVYQGGSAVYRYWWQENINTTVINDMYAVASGRRSLASNQALGLRIQTPTGAELILLMVRAPSGEDLASAAQASRGPNWLLTGLRSLFGRALPQAQTRPPQLHNTLVGFFIPSGPAGRGSTAYETTPTTQIP
jgi:hypothetical protein